jgi:hypothetical protein
LVLKRGQGGFGAVLGSFVVPLALIYARTHTSESLEDEKVTTLVILFSLMFFAVGHAAARAAPVARILAGVTSLVLGIQAIAIAADHHFSRDTDRLLSAGWIGGLTATGFAIAVAGLALRKQTGDDFL